MISAAPYRGRFAPSPTGPLHFGSIIAALGSFLEARSRNGEWLLRIEDVDAPRCKPAASREIITTLEAFGFVWDGDIMYQSTRPSRYRETLDQLVAKGLAFSCACSRKELAALDLVAIDGGQRYPGTCRDGISAGRAPRAWRLRVDNEGIEFSDTCQGNIVQHLERDVGDFPLLRADGYFAYQLAVVVDDFDQGITDVVRGSDLLDSTPRQIFLQRCLGFPTPRYLHLPVALNSAGEKLSKQTLAAPVDPSLPVLPLWAALDFLCQSPPTALKQGSRDEFWQWAFSHWDSRRIPRQRGIAIRAYSL